MYAIEYMSWLEGGPVCRVDVNNSVERCGLNKPHALNSRIVCNSILMSNEIKI